MVERIPNTCKLARACPEPGTKTNHWWLPHFADKRSRGRIFGPTDQPVPRLPEDESSHSYSKAHTEPPYRDTSTACCMPPGCGYFVYPFKTPYPPSRRYRNATRAREICRINPAVETRHLCQTGNRKNCHSSGDPHGTALSLTLTSETM